MKFQIGDRVAANELSDGKYYVTCKRNNYTGYVIRYITDREFEISEDPKTSDGYGWTVSEDCFDFISAAEPAEPLEAPDEDLFSSLFG